LIHANDIFDKAFTIECELIIKLKQKDRTKSLM